MVIRISKVVFISLFSLSCCLFTGVDGLDSSVEQTVNPKDTVRVTDLIETELPKCTFHAGTYKIFEHIQLNTCVTDRTNLEIIVSLKTFNQNQDCFTKETQLTEEAGILCVGQKCTRCKIQTITDYVLLDSSLAGDIKKIYLCPRQTMQLPSTCYIESIFWGELLDNVLVHKQVD